MKHVRMWTTLVGASALGVTSGALAQEENTDFRILPYLQNPSSESMTFSWFTQTRLDSTLTISGGDLTTPIQQTLRGEYQENLEYTDKESADALNKGYDLFTDSNYKYTTNVTGLSAGTEYNYTVELGSGDSFTQQFRTAPSATDWESIRFVALSDAETEPRGRTRQRDWAAGVQAPGSAGRPASWPKDSSGRDLYVRTENRGYRDNLQIIDQRDPDFVITPGDLVQGGGYQLGWDEFFRHNAGEFDDVLTKRAILPVLGNWENYGAINGGYDPEAVQKGREKYKTYFDAPANNNPDYQDQYYRTDYGPVTVLSLDSSNGLPDDERSNYTQPVADPYANGTDTQSNVNQDTYPGNDLADFNPGSDQWNWVMEQLEDARDKGQMVFVQFHHTPFSSGTHGFGMGHPDSSGQGGNPMRVYHDKFEEYGVLAVFAGHSEMFERSFVDEDGDGIGVNYYDVGVSGDGMRGRKIDSLTGEFGTQNPFSQWTADGDSEEFWVDNGDGTYTLVDGGKHGFGMGHPDSSGQGGNPMRVYHDKFEEYGVLAVLAGHSEMFERSFVDEDGDGIGVHYYDVGVSGDGMRGRKIDSLTGEFGTQNPFSQWTADGDSEEFWVDNGDGTYTLVDGGKHYGHLEVNIEKLLAPEGDAVARALFSPVYSFPIFELTAEGLIELEGQERRVYADEISLLIDAQGRVVPEPTSALAMLLSGSLLVMRRRRKA